MQRKYKKSVCSIPNIKRKSQEPVKGPVHHKIEIKIKFNYTKKYTFAFHFLSKNCSLVTFQICKSELVFLLKSLH